MARESYDPHKLYEILAGAYTCQFCDRPSTVAIVAPNGELVPVCATHAQQAARQGGVIIRQGQPATRPDFKQ